MREKNNFSIQSIQLVILLVAACIVLPLLYMSAINSPALQDEFYILSYLKELNSSNNLINQSFISFKGVEATDTFSFISAAILNVVSGLSVNLIRLLSLAIHITNVIFVYLVMTKAISQKTSTIFFGEKINIFALLIACCFAIYPLTAEAIFWIGSIAYTTGLLFLLISYFLYFLGKEKRSWRFILLGSLLYLIALFTDTSLWSASFVLIGLEMARNFIGPKSTSKTVDQNAIDSVEDIEDAVDKLLESEKEEKLSSTSDSQPKNTKTQNKKDDDDEDIFDSLLPALPYLGLGAIIPLGGLPAYGTEQLGQEMIIQFSDWIAAIKAFLFPINESITIGYNKQYSFLYILYAIGILAFPIALARSKAYRQNVVFLFIWLLMAMVPHLHHIVSNDTMTGARWFYHASIPISAIIVLFFGAINFIGLNLSSKIKRYFQMFGSFLSICLIVILIVFMFLKTRSQIRAYKVAAILSDDLRFSIKSISSKEKHSVLIVRNVPENATIANLTNPFNLIQFDGKTQLINAPHLVGGNLKDQLKENKLKNSSFFWEHNSKSLYPIEYGTILNATLSQLKANQLKERIIPPINVLASTSYDEDTDTIKLFSNKKSGPVLTISANGFDPLGGDFVYLDAKISTPDRTPKDIELTWNTTWGKELERRDRISQAKTITNDDQFNRYYFPVRSTAWSTNGKIQKISLLFPNTANVEIKEIGQTNAPERIPSLSLINPTKLDSKSFFSQGLYNYPNNPELGVQTILGKDKDLKFQYNASSIKNASKVICEVSRLNKFFHNPNGTRLSKQPLKILRLSNLEGKIIVKSKILRKNGIYSFRIFATDINEKIVSNSSDAVCCFIDRSLSVDRNNED